MVSGVPLHLCMESNAATNILNTRKSFGITHESLYCIVFFFLANAADVYFKVLT